MSHPAPSPTVVAPDHPPDWPATPGDLPCPLCEYNLRGLVDPRCPECGYSFSWTALLDARRHAHPYLFEHHPRCNVRSFCRTFLAGFRPASFWTRLLPAHTVRPRRLAVYWTVTAALLLLLAAAVFGRRHYDAASRLSAIRASGVAPTAQAAAERHGLTLAQWLDLCNPPPGTPRWFRFVGRIANADLVPPLALILAWPYATAATLLTFRQSMRQARVRPAQILRCTIYSGDPAPVLFLALIVIQFLREGSPPASNFAVNLLPRLYVLYASYRLTRAYDLYLRFDRPVATVLASQVIVALAAVKLSLVWDQF